MPISFTIFEEQGYYIARIVGRVTDDDILAAFKEFHSTQDATKWNVLADFGDADLRGVTEFGVGQQVHNVRDRYRASEPHTVRTAVYAPDDLGYGLVRMYLARADDIPQSVRLFRDKNEALAWLLGDEPSGLEPGRESR